MSIVRHKSKQRMSDCDLRRGPTRVPFSVRAIAAALLPIVVVLAAGSCANQSKSGAYSPMSEGERSTARAEQLCNEAVDLLAEHPDQVEQAETLLRVALNADLYHGPSHNNLGVLYLKQGKLYEAAGEFEWARRLLPGHPDPRFNLALVLERAGRVDDAIDSYDAALAVQPGHMPSMQAVSRVSIRHARSDPRVDGYLQEIVMRGDTPEWRKWAEKQIVLRLDDAERAGG